MKKLFCILISALMALSVFPFGAISFAEAVPEPQAGQAEQPAEQAEKPAENLGEKPVEKPKPERGDTRLGDVVFDFEATPDGEGFHFWDADGDGNNWFYDFDMGTWYGCHDGDGAMSSISWDEYDGAFDPDNWMITPPLHITGSSTIDFWIRSGDDRYTGDKVEVLASLDGGESWEHITNVYAEEDWDLIGADIADWEGYSVILAFRHWDSYNVSGVNLDDITISDAELASSAISRVNALEFSVPEFGDFASDLLPHASPTVPYEISNIYWIANYGGSDHIMDSSDQFNRTDATYRLHVEYEPVSWYYTFSSSCVARFNGLNQYVGSISRATRKITVESSVFTVSPGTAIDEVSIQGFSVPQINATAADYLDRSVPSGAHYHIVNIAGMDDTTGQQLTASSVFAGGHYYSINVYIEADEGYYFSEDCVYLFNYQITDVDSGVSGRDSYTSALVASKSTQAMYPLSYINLNIASFPPIVGETAVNGPEAVTVGYPYYEVIEFQWYDAETYEPFNGTFQAGHQYFCYCHVVPVSDYYFFVPDAEAAIFGDDDLVDGGTARVEADYRSAKIYSVDMTPVDEDHIIYYASVNGVIPPMAGGSVDEFYSSYYVDDTEPYEIVACSAAEVLETDYQYLPNGYVYETGHQYIFSFNLQPKEGYVFAPDCVLRINGQGLLVDDEVSNSEDPYFAYITTPALEALTPIHTVFLEDFTIPIMIGDNAEECLNMFSYDSRIEIYHSTWFDTDTDQYFTDDFEEGGSYYCGCAMRAADGYCFAPDCVFYINNTDTYVGWSFVEGDLRTAQAFTIPLEPADDSKLIHSVDLIEFAYPIVGETAENYLTTVQAVSSAHYYVDRIEGGELSAGLMGYDDVFEAGHEYYLAVHVVTDYGYYIADDCTFWLEGTNAYVDTEGTYKAGPNSAWIGIGPCPAKQLITELAIYADIAPVAGESAEDHLSYYVDGNAHCSYTCWVDFSNPGGDVLNFDGAFVEGNDYYRHFAISADDGYMFADELTVTVAGVPAGYEVSTVGMMIQVDSVAYTSLPAIGEIDLEGVKLPQPGQTVAEYKAQLGVPSGADYTIAFIGIMHSGTIAYLPDDYVFVSGESYAVYTYFNPVNGRMFTESNQLNFLVNGQGYMVENGSLIEDDRTTAMCYTKELVCVDEEHTIHTINVKGFVPPMIGHTVDEFFSGCYIADGQHYYIGAISAADVTDPEDPQYIHFGYDYEAGYEYEYAFTLQPDEGYYFAPDCEFWFDWDGTYVNYTRSNASDPQAAYLCTIPLSALTPITFVSLDGFTIPPMIGENAEDCLGISIYYSNGDCEIIDETWIDTDYDNFTGTFTAYDEYQCAVTLLVDDGFCFDPNCTVLVNGSQYYLDNAYVSSSCYVMYVYTVFLEAVDDSHFIHSIDLSGLVWPVIGAPVTDFITCLEPGSDAHYTIASRTGGESGSAPFEGDEYFEAGHSYILSVSVQADPGWYIADDCTFYVDGLDVYLDPDGTYKVSEGFAQIMIGPLEAKTAITEVRITGYKPAIVGDPSSSHMVSIHIQEDAGYELLDCAWFVTDPDTMEWERFNGRFEAGPYYHMGFALGSEDGYIFTNDTVVYINDQQVDFTLQGSGTSLQTSTEPTFALDALMEINILNVRAPIAGETLYDYLYGLEVPEGAAYDFNGCAMRNLSTGSQMGLNDVFEAGVQYSLTVRVMATGDNLISNGATLLINGSAELVDYSQSGVYGDSLRALIVSNALLCEEPAGLPGDVNCDGQVNSTDALLAMRYAMGLVTVTPAGLANGDINGDGRLNATDAIAIMRMVMAG